MKLLFEDRTHIPLTNGGLSSLASNAIGMGCTLIALLKFPNAPVWCVRNIRDYGLQNLGMYLAIVIIGKYW